MERTVGLPVVVYAEWTAWWWLWLECLTCGIPCRGCSIARILAAIENVPPRDRERFSEFGRSSSERSWNVGLTAGKINGNIGSNVHDFEQPRYDLNIS